jgi:thiol-disulfide isomerase/thioredoxin
LLIALLGIAATAVVVARRTTPEAISTVAAPTDIASLPVLADAAPEVTASTWFNSTPLDSQSLRGKVVLYDFWTFGCINCRHTQPYVQAWHDRYARDGLVVVSVHTPEFAYEADPDNVRRYVRENRITYPVALDPDRSVWAAFGNRYWPAFYLHDRAGHRRLLRIGEGSYASTEDAIRALLGVAASAPRATVDGTAR